MFLLREDMNNHDITLLPDRAAVISHLHARMIAGVDVDNAIDVFPVELGSRVDTSASIVLSEA
jgi:hypothetical protein